MKKRVLSLLLVLCLLAGLFPALPASAADAPDKLYLEPSAASNIPSRIDLYPDPSGGTDQYHMYLPGNAAAGSCFLSWEGGASASMGGKSYASGTLPIPTPGQTETVTISGKTFHIRTYQGSPSVKAIFLEIDESQGTIAAMNSDPRHNTTCTGQIVIDGERMALPQIKGRGNTTWSSAVEKRPYNIKLDQKVTLLGIDCDKTKKWSLLANVNDRTLLRNKVAYDLAHTMGIGFDSASVDLWMNGVYNGTYLLTPKTDSYISDDGFLLEDNNITDDEDPHFNVGSMIINVKEIGKNWLEGGVESTETTNAAVRQIQSYFQDVWNAIHADSGYNSKGKYYTDYFDIDSMAAFFLLHEFIKNLEVDGGSIMLTRQGKTDEDKLIAGPAWDYDNSMGYNGQQTMAAGGSGWPSDVRSTNYASLSVGNWYITGRNRGKLFGDLSKHEDFLDLAHEVYNRYAAAFDDVSANVRRQEALIAASAEMNFARITKETKNNFDFPDERVNGKYYGQTQFDAGTPYEINYKAPEVWSEYVDNLVTYTTGRARFFHDQMYVESTCQHDYKAVVTPATCTEKGYTTWTCSKCGDSYTDGETPALGHDFVNGVCSRCGQAAMQATFACGEGVTVTVHKTQAADSEVIENAETAFPRDSGTGEIDVSGSGQINFVVNVAPGYQLESITVEPKSNYKNFKPPEETLVPNGYRITKMTGSVTVTIRTVKTECQHSYTAAVTPPSCTAQGYTTYTCSKCGDSYRDNYTAKVAHNYVNGACAVCGEKLLTATIAADAGASVSVYETQKPDSAHADDAKFANPRDGDSGLIDCSGEGQINFVVNVAEGYELESVTAEPASSYKNLKGPADTGVENGYRITKVKGEFTIMVRTRRTGAAVCDHDYQPSVTAPTCTAQGYTTFTCTKCGDSFVDEYTAKADHDYVNGVCAVCGEKLFSVAIVCGEGASVTVYETQKADGPKEENASSANPRDGDTGRIDCSGDGQVNFEVVLADGYELDSVAAEPAESYKNLKGPEDTGAENRYRVTKVAAPLTITVTAKKAGVGPHDHQYVAVVTPPTCTEKGYTTYTCSICGDSYTDDEVDELIHIWPKEGVVTKQATATERGELTFTCERCGQTKTRPIAAGTEKAHKNEILFISDVHSGLYAEEGYHNLRAMFRLLRENDDFVPEVVCGGGDYLETRSNDDADWPHCLEVLQDIMYNDSPDTAQALIVGNHEWEWSRMSDEMIELLFGNPRTGSFYSSDDFAIFQIGAHTNSGNKEHFKSKDLTALRSFLESQVGNGKVIFIQTHWALHYGYNSESWRTTDNADEMIELLNEFADRMDIVFVWGHNHNTDEMRHELRVRGDTLQIAKSKTMQIEFTYINAGCLNEKHAEVDAGPEGSKYGPGYLLEARIVGDKLILDYGHITGAYPDPSQAKYDHNADLLYVEEIQAAKESHHEIQLLHHGGCEHEYAAVVTAPTCTEGGFTTYTCAKCGDSYVDDETAALGHSLVRHAAKAPTCTEAGWSAYDTCAHCDYTTYAELPAAGHQPAAAVKEKEVAPTCTGAGSYDEVVYCSVCRAELRRTSNTVAALGHDYRAAVTAPTCTEAGYTTHTCARCGDRYTDNETAALGHAWDAGVVTKEPTETSTGVRTFTCTRCGEKRAEVIPELSHEHRYTAVVTPPTCTEEGYTTHTCTCGESYVDTKVAALGHAFGTWAVSKAATCTAKGAEARTCIRCDAKETREIAALGHDLTAHAAKAPTCTETGWAAYETCSRCDYSTYAELAALEHDYKDGVCTRCGAADPDYVPPLDKAVLQAAIAAADAIDRDGYTPESVAAMEAALTAAKAALEADTQAAVDKAAAALDAAIKALVEKPIEEPVDYSALNAAIEAAEKLDLSKYTAASVAAFNKALEAAKAARTAGKQADADAAKDALEAAVKALKEKPPFRFDDVKDETQYFFDPVYWAVDQEITNGTSPTTFSPDAGCTRAQVVTFLWRAAGKPQPSSSKNPFEDVKAGQYYYDAVLWAVEKGITTGTGPNTFRPDATCTRAQIVTFLWRYFDKPEPRGGSAFADVDSAQYYAKAIAWAVEKGVTKGTSADRFSPNATCTRAQIVTFLYRAMEE